MRKKNYAAAVMVAFAVVAGAACPAPAVASTVSASGVRADCSRCGYEVTADGVRLRTGPGARYGVLGLLRRGEPVYADRSRDGWFRVSLAYGSGSDFGTRKTSGLKESTTGWVASKYLRANVCTQLD
ncbi:SH3 domain-containing protein [Streptomyces sp. NPDC002573]|uniref:SH3 domain-containing protein n=1 Tax=Streptomyces sp. NPDC002573 TaxID=3364651 RepID=UPI003697CE4E